MIRYGTRIDVMGVTNFQSFQNSEKKIHGQKGNCIFLSFFVIFFEIFEILTNFFKKFQKNLQNPIFLIQNFDKRLVKPNFYILVYQGIHQEKSRFYTFFTKKSIILLIQIKVIWYKMKIWYQENHQEIFFSAKKIEILLRVVENEKLKKL